MSKSKKRQERAIIKQHHHGWWYWAIQQRWTKSGKWEDVCESAAFDERSEALEDVRETFYAIEALLNSENVER